MVLLRRCGVVSVAFLMCASAGCTRYEPKPLDPKLTLQQIQRVTLEDVLAHDSASSSQPTSPKAFDPTDGLSENEVAVAAMFLNPQLRAKRQEHGIAAAQLISAGLWPNPDFDGKFQWDTKGPGREIEANLAIEVLRWKERKGEKEAAKANLQAVIAEIMAAEWKVVTDARVAYWNVVGLEAKLRANQLAVGLADDLIKAISVRIERGAGNQFDLNLAQLDRLRFQSEALRTETDVEAARRTLIDVLGLPPSATVKLQVERDNPTPLLRDWSLESLTEFLPEAPRVKAQQWRYAASEGELRAAIARQFPSLKLGPATDFTYNGNAWESVIGSLVAFQVPFLNRNGAQIKEKTSARDLARANYHAELHALRAELADAVGVVRSLEKRILFNEKEVLPKVNESVSLSEKAFTAGEISTLSLLRAQTSVIEAKISYYDVLLEHRRTLQRIEAALGRRLESVPVPAASADQQLKPDAPANNVNPTQER